MTKILLAGGCSYTALNFMSQDKTLPDEKRGGWPMWPEHVGNNLGLNVINTAYPGLDNLTIHNKIFTELLKHKDNIGFVCVLWSGYDRFRFINSDSSQLVHILKRAEGKDHIHTSRPTSHLLCQSEFFDFWTKLVSHKDFNTSEVIEGSFIDSFTYMNSIAEICDLRKIPYIFYQGVHPFRRDVHPFNHGNIFNESLKKILKDPMFAHTEKRKKNIIGWPFMEAFGGHCVDSRRNSWGKLGGDWEAGLAISKSDYHPNAEGQKWISEVFMKKYQELTND